jgi:ribulose-phosphate 3-epimerase
VSHGYADAEGTVAYDNMQLFEAALPYTTEVHLKNTDAIFNATFGFMEEEREQGIVDIAAARRLLLDSAERLPVSDIVGYLEINGPKTGRDYSDCQLERMLRESLRWCRKNFET